jgi:hypothetical protein
MDYPLYGHLVSVEINNSAVARTIAWLNRHRRLAKDIEATVRNSVT